MLSLEAVEMTELELSNRLLDMFAAAAEPLIKVTLELKGSDELLVSVSYGWVGMLEGLLFTEAPFVSLVEPAAETVLCVDAPVVEFALVVFDGHADATECQPCFT